MLGCKLPIDTASLQVARRRLERPCGGSRKQVAKSSDLLRLWMGDKRFKNQITLMVLIPFILSVIIPMIFEYLLPSLCRSWQRSNRRDRNRGCCAKCCCASPSPPPHTLDMIL